MTHDADAFLAEAHHYRLGELPTETPHPLTRDLSRLATQDPAEAVEVLRRVDLDALDRLPTHGIAGLREAVRDTLANGHRVFLCGCGATGRLSLSLEVLWRETHPGSEAVQGFMAGGDLALVRSVERFEDVPEYGARQLQDLGFTDSDLLISTTEGGETPFVIGATEHAASLSKRPPWFLYCNPDDVLRSRVERSRRVLDDPRIRKVNLHVGPMGLTGSTRMQASTVLMLAVGDALLHDSETARELRDAIAAAPLDRLVPLIERESAVYQQGGFVLYEAGRHAITVLTDTTERSPTFSLRAFENRGDEDRRPSLCFFHLPGTATSEDAWTELLHRSPRPLTWPDIAHIAGRERLLGFDFSDDGARARRALLGRSHQVTIGVSRDDDDLVIGLVDGTEARLPAPRSLLHEHLLLKVALNIHSTLVMGRIGRYERNLMTFVRPSNKKLIDRSIRYVQHLLREDGVADPDYEAVARACFEEMRGLDDDEAIVLRVYQRLRGTLP